MRPWRGEPIVQQEIETWSPRHDPSIAPCRGAIAEQNSIPHSDNLINARRADLPQQVRRNIVKVVALWILALCVTAHAETLETFPNPKYGALPINVNSPSIPCDKIVGRLQEYAKMTRENEVALLSFLGDVASRVRTWYDVLQPLEGTSQTIAVETFAPVREGANQISKINDMASENMELLVRELNLISTSLQACAIK
jgi:hypothetical protein